MADTTNKTANESNQATVMGGDTGWIVPFYLVIISGIVFFFAQVAQYGLLPH